MRQWLLPAVGGVIVALLSVFAKDLWYGEGDQGGATLEAINREEMHKRIEKMKLSAIRLASDGRYDEAMPIFHTLIDLNHHDQFSYVQLAKVLRDLGDARFEKLVAASGERPAILGADRIVGAVYYQVGDWKKAKEHLDRFLRQSPRDLSATYYLGAIALREGEFERADRLLTDVITREKTYYFAYLDLLDLAEKRGDKEKADAYLKLAWKYNPANNKEGVCCGLPLTTEQKNS